MGCQPQTTTSKSDTINNHLSLFITQLKKENTQLVKYITKDNQTDTLIVDSINWEKELAMFIKYDLSEKKKKLYEIEEVGCEKIYKPKDDKQQLKKLKINKCDNLSSITMDIVKNSKLYTYLYHLELNNSGFLITSKQQVEFIFDTDYRIEGKFKQ